MCVASKKVLCHCVALVALVSGTMPSSIAHGHSNKRRRSVTPSWRLCIVAIVHTHIFHTFCALSVLHLEVALQMSYRSIQCDSTVAFNTATVFAHGAVNQSAVAHTSELFQMLPFQIQNSTWALWIVGSSIVSCASPLNDYLTQEPSQTQKSQTQEDCLVLQIISSSCSALRSA